MDSARETKRTLERCGTIGGRHAVVGRQREERCGLTFGGGIGSGDAIEGGGCSRNWRVAGHSGDAIEEGKTDAVGQACPGETTEGNG
jgi:hypothetical protein